jgi:hypothetical protein
VPKHVVVIYIINIIYIYQIVVLDNRYTPILVYKDTTGITNHMICAEHPIFIIYNAFMIISRPVLRIKKCSGQKL